MIPALLDVNVLIALFDPAHPNHDQAHDWFGANHSKGWATCTITVNGCVRILSSSSYPSFRVTPAAVINGLRQFCGSPFHSFWPDTTNLLDDSVFRPDLLPSHSSITDAALLALACRNRGRLVTFDSGIALAAAKGATARHLVTLV